MAQDPYKELGVARTASHDEARKAFRKLAKELHPDKNPGDKKAEERFKRVSAAFDIVGDEEKRKKFDRGEIDADGRDRHPGFNPGGGGFQGFGGGGARPGAGGEFEGVNFEEILGEMLNRGGQGQGQGPFAGAARGFGGGRGADVRARLDIDLVDAITGAMRRISFGDGRTLEVAIPKGAHEGQVLRLRGQGQPGRGQAPAGDALIELAVRPHPVFRQDGADLHMDLPVSIPDAVLGAKIDAPTPEGVVSLTVPKGANAGAVLRLKRRGAVDPETGARGDLFAHIALTLPEGEDPTLTAFAEEWRTARPYSPRRPG